MRGLEPSSICARHRRICLVISDPAALERKQLYKL